MQIHFVHVAVALMIACLCDNVNAGKFTTAKGSECVWMERKYNDTMTDDQVVKESVPMIRGFFFFCKCKGEQSQIDYVCEYVGDMKDCPPYRRQSTVFWDQLIRYFSKQDHACIDLRLDVGKATSLCAGSDIVLEKESPRPNIQDNPFNCRSYLLTDDDQDRVADEL